MPTEAFGEDSAGLRLDDLDPTTIHSRRVLTQDSDMHTGQAGPVLTGLAREWEGQEHLALQQHCYTAASVVCTLAMQIAASFWSRHADHAVTVQVVNYNHSHAGHDHTLVTATHWLRQGWSTLADWVKERTPS